MRRLAIGSAIATLLTLSATPAMALSCIESEPIDWSERFPKSKAAVIGVIEEVEPIDGDHTLGELMLRVRVSEVLHGNVPKILEYTTPNFDPWGPYYEVGEEIAIVIENGEVSDGKQNICGPWFSPDELRAAASQFGTEEPTTLLDRILAVLFELIRLLFE